MLRFLRDKVIVKNEKEICAPFAVPLQNAKVMATVCGNCLVKMEKAMNSYIKIFCERVKEISFA